MAPKIFLTGATGYIGGDILHVLATEHPEYEVSVLVRNQERAKQVTDSYSKVRIVIGGLDDSETLEKEAARADVVIHTADASDHVGAAKAIAKGLASGHTSSKPGYWLHTGGAGILTYFDSAAERYGEHTDKIFDDWDGIEEITNLPSEAFHRNVDEIVLETGKKHAENVKTALICPPTIYGAGRGPVNQRSRQAYTLGSFILTEKYVPRIGKGKAQWSQIHVHDLANLFILLTQQAVSAADSTSGPDPTELWGAKGYYFAENGHDFVWGDLAEQFGREIVKQGLLGEKETEVRELSFQQAVDSPAGFESASWGMNSRSKAIRAGKLLGWKAKGKTLEEVVPEIVGVEAERLKSEK